MGYQGRLLDLYLNYLVSTDDNGLILTYTGFLVKLSQRLIMIEAIEPFPENKELLEEITSIRKSNEEWKRLNPHN